MACACKRRTKNKKYQNATGTFENKGFWGYMKLIGKMFLSRICMPIFLLLICLLLLPLIIVVLIITQIFFGEAKIILPHKFMLAFNNIKNNTQNGE